MHFLKEKMRKFKAQDAPRRIHLNTSTIYKSELVDVCDLTDDEVDEVCRSFRVSMLRRRRTMKPGT